MGGPEVNTDIFAPPLEICDGICQRSVCDRPRSQPDLRKSNLTSGGQFIASSGCNLFANIAHLSVTSELQAVNKRVPW
jgi:hypothetical protein